MTTDQRVDQTTYARRRDYMLALSRADLSRAALRAAIALCALCDWSTGRTRKPVTGRRLAYELRAGIRETRRAVGELRAAGWLSVADRGHLDTPVYELTRPVPSAPAAAA